MGDEMLLLGAGASVEAGIPDAKQMAREIVRLFNGDSSLEKEAEVLNFVNDRLTAHAKKIHPFIDVDIEALYNAILSLSERGKLEISSFVQSWVPDLIKIKDANTLFANIMLKMERMLEELTLIKDERKVDYLKPILNLAKSGDGLFIATLNYDNGIELLSKVNGVACETGIESWTREGFFNFPNKGIALGKLHGSNYWFWTNGTSTYGERLSHRQVRFKLSHDQSLPKILQVETPMVIFGQRNKLTAEGPFLDLLKEFDEQLQRTNTLTAIGYSFRDSHINFYISKFLNQYRGKIKIVSPDVETSDVDYVQDLREFRKTRSDQIDMIEKNAGDALKTLYP